MGHSLNSLVKLRYKDFHGTPNSYTITCVIGLSVPAHQGVPTLEVGYTPVNGREKCHIKKWWHLKILLREIIKKIYQNEGKRATPT